MRKLDEIRKDIEDVAGRLQIAKVYYADLVLEAIEIGYDVNKHPASEEYRKKIIALVDELDDLSDEHHKVFYS